ncbi:MAG: response regulator [Verrucomicrobiota bacterium]
MLILEDDANDVLLLKRALNRLNICNPLFVAHDGIEAIEYLQGKGRFQDRKTYPFPEVILLDLKMPRMDGLEFLSWLDEHREFKVIPTVVLSSSDHEKDVLNAYQHCASSFFVKPSTVGGYEQLVRLIHDYWERSVKPSIR